MRHLISASILAALYSSAGADQFAPKTTISTSATSEALSDGLRGWSDNSFHLRHDFAQNSQVGFGVSKVKRFDLSDTQVTGSVVFPIGSALSTSFDAGYSDSHRILAHHFTGATLQYKFLPSWLVRGGIKATKYADASVKQASLTFEHYFMDYSVSASWYPTRVSSTTAHSYAAQAAWYYGDNHSVGVTLAKGREISTLPVGVALGDVDSAALVGRHALSRNWTGSYGLSYTRQGSLYTRKGVTAGLAYTF